MESHHLIIHERPSLIKPRLIMGFSGWMDGGDVSTGTIEFLVENLRARVLAEINPDMFYIYNFPGSMEISALFRPYIQLKDGIVDDYEEPSNIFYYDTHNQLIFFNGKEPNLNWHEFVRAIFSLVEYFDVEEIYYVGSFAGMVPHTREPRISATVSDKSFKPRLSECNINFSNYQGPGSIVNYILRGAHDKKIPMASIVAEIPPYIQGRNPHCIEAVLKRLSRLLEIDLDLEELRLISDELEKKLDRAIEKRAELAQHIKKLEENYDTEVFDTNMEDLKNWLIKQGIRVD